MDENTQYEERRELVDIYNSLSSPLKKQLLTLARIIDTTHDITLNEANGTNSTIHNQE